MLAPLPRERESLPQQRMARLLRAALWPLLLGCAALSGCETGYVLQAARGQAGVLAARRPMDRVIADPRTEPQLRERLVLLRDARDFASRELGLPDNRSYRSFASLPREFVVWNVIAAPEFSTKPREWCFPVAGCVSYRGYFHESAAQRYAQRLRQRGDDVLVAGVPAYSTLGHFADPLLSTMLRYDDVYVAGTIFHELAHQLLYVKDDPSFNESFASTVEQAGLQRWLAARGRSDELQAWRNARQRERWQQQRIDAARADLARLYASGAPAQQMRALKRARFEQLAQELRGAAAASGRVLNNADLAISATYWICVPQLEAELAAVGGDLPRFYERARALARLSRSERHARVCRGTAAAATP